jgi:hypothetical protein
VSQPPKFNDGLWAPMDGYPAAPAAPQQPWPTVPGGYPPQPPPPWTPPPSQNRRVPPWVIVVAGVAVVVVAVLAAVGVAGTQTRSSANSPAGTGCNAAAPKGASPAARQFLAATAAADVYWAQIGSSMKAGGGVGPNDLSAQVSADNGFLVALNAISYPASAQAAASSLEQVITEYDGQLSLGYNAYAADPSQVYALDNERAHVSGTLRQALGIANTVCVVDRP